ncbi:MAG: alcohol dehydrogenase [Planctomycetes bacterium DG_23]|nr:MAG: alcohol dehydrogenase [Planctomycetes bacterium DG_23]
MKAIVYDGKSVKFEPDYPRPRRPSGEALIKMIVSGICRTDLEIAKGYMDFQGVLGHEFVGEVTYCENKEWLGKRVVGEINCSCGRCGYCRAGLRYHCPDRTVLGIKERDGSFAEYFTLPEKNLHIIPEKIDNETAVFAEPLAACCQILRQTSIGPGEDVVILGDGKLGLLMAQVLDRTGCRLLAVGKHPHKLGILQKRAISTALMSEIPKAKFDMVVECTGSPGGISMALDLVKPRGIIVLKTTLAEKTLAHLAPIVINEVTIVGSRCGPMDMALAALEKGQVTVKPLITDIFPLDEAQKAINRAHESDSIKVLLKPA